MATDARLPEPHEFDLPQLYQKPSAASLKEALTDLTLEATTFSSVANGSHSDHQYVHSRGITTYLTSIISSPLGWIEGEDDRERIWDLTSRRLSERSGRTAMGDLTRIFTIPRPTTTGEDLIIKLHEPALTEDNLGFKTWSSSFALACQLERLDLLAGIESVDDSVPRPFVLELGSGTGLLGIAAAAIWKTGVVLTDLPEIIPNLQRNVIINEKVLKENLGSAQCQALDWSLEPEVNRLAAQNTQVMFILVADPIYSPEHPKILLNTIYARLHRNERARVVIAYPIRGAYQEQIIELRSGLSSAGLKPIEESIEICQDDWVDEVTCSCSVWCWA